MKKALILFVFSVFANVACAQPSKSYYFADTLIDIFTDIRNEPFPLEESKKKGDLPFKSILKLAVHREQVFDRAYSRLKILGNLDDATFKESAEIFSVSIVLLQISNSDIKNYAESVLNSPELVMKQGTTLRKIAELKGASEDAWKAYAESSSIVTYPLMDGVTSLKEFKQQDPQKMMQPIKKLRLTKAEIELLKMHLQKSFGQVLADNTKAGYIDVPAIVMWRFLNDDWIPASD